jgi:penicillin-binding protein 2
MRRIVSQEQLIGDNRFLWAHILVLAVSSVLMIRLWYVQIYRGEYYTKVAERNRIRRFEVTAPRGTIYDRNGKVILGNRPFYDLVYIPQYVKDKEATFKILSRLLHLQMSYFERRLRLGSGRPKYMPIVLKRNMSLHEVSAIESNKVFLPGVEVRVVPMRDYNAEVPAHLVGYLGEIDAKALTSLNRKNQKEPYFPGDLIGKHGLEARWENSLRGKNGHVLIQVDAFGRKIIPKEGEAFELPSVAARKGSDLELTIDLELQKVATQAFKGKYGAVLAVKPNTGEILAMVSEPGFDPTIYQRSLSREEWYSLINNPYKPLFDKTTGGEYIPGSIYKTVVAIAAVEEGIVNPSTTHFCPGHFTLGDQTYQCWEKGGHGIVNLKKALMRSCDVFFYQTGVELGVDKIAMYAKKLGLGKLLGVNLNLERPGLIPTAAWKRQITGTAWQPGDTPNIAIGQGYNLLTPIQMASLYSVIANGGSLWKPFLVKRVTNHIGETTLLQEPELVLSVDGIKPETFAMMRSYLKEVVMNPEGTGKNAAVKDFTVAGKTGSAQVVSLKKNANNKQDNVSVKWKEHAIFTAFSPVENAEIAIAIVSENDAVGGGGAQAAPVAQRIIEAYFELKKRRENPNGVQNPNGDLTIGAKTEDHIGGKKQ